jgi:hypothetical protein
MAVMVCSLIPIASGAPVVEQEFMLEPLDFVLPNCRHRLDVGAHGLRRL